MATDPRRVRRTGAAVLDLAGADALPAGLLDELGPTLLPVATPLCLPLAPGVALAQYPDNGMTFGEHRCLLVALGLRHAARRRAGRDRRRVRAPTAWTRPARTARAEPRPLLGRPDPGCRARPPKGQAWVTSPSMLRVRFESTGMPGPIVVAKVTFFRYLPFDDDGLARSTSSSAAA